MEKWVSKIEATSMFKVTERTLDNWVKSSKISKTRRNGQICYEVSGIMAERNISDHREAPIPTVQAPPAPIIEPQKIDEGPSRNEIALEARLDEKQTLINKLSENLEKENRNLNTLAQSNGGISEKVTLYQGEIESLRKEKEDLRKEKETILNQKEALSERSFSRFGTYLFVLMMILFISGGISIYVWKNKAAEKVYEDSNSAFKGNIQKLTLDKEKLKLGITQLVKDQDAHLQKRTSELLSKMDELYKEIIKKEKAISATKESSFVLNQNISEEKEKASELQKQLERLLKAHEEALKENTDLKLKVGIAEALKNRQTSIEKERTSDENFKKHVMESSTE